MQTRRITVHKILFFETVSEFSVLSIFIFFILSAYRGKFANFCTLLQKNFVRCPLPGGVRSREGRSNLKKNLSLFGKFCFVRLWEVSAVGRVRL